MIFWSDRVQQHILNVINKCSRRFLHDQLAPKHQICWIIDNQGLHHIGQQRLDLGPSRQLATDFIDHTNDCFSLVSFPQVNPKDLYLLPTQLQPSQYTFSPLHLPDRNPSHFSQLALQTKLLTYFKRVSLSLGSVIITVTSSAYAVRNNGLNGL